MKYRKKPVVIEAFQMTRERRLDNSEWPTWLHEAWQKLAAEPGALFCAEDHCSATETHTLFIQRWGGSRKVEWGDWIIHDEDGIHACDPEFFEEQYESAEVKPFTQLGPGAMW